MNETMVDRNFYPKGLNKYVLLHFFANVKRSVKTHLEDTLRIRQHPIQWYTVVQIKLYKEDKGGEISTVDLSFVAIRTLR